MQYMLLIYEDENALRSPQVMQEVVAAHMRLAAELREKGFLVAGDGFQPSETARTVRDTALGTIVHDGPYPDAHEQLGGYYLIDVADEKAALSWARQVPVTAGGGVEVRPLMTY